MFRVFIIKLNILRVSEKEREATWQNIYKFTATSTVGKTMKPKKKRSRINLLWMEENIWIKRQSAGEKSDSIFHGQTFINIIKGIIYIFAINFCCLLNELFNERKLLPLVVALWRKYMLKVFKWSHKKPFKLFRYISLSFMNAPPSSQLWEENAGISLLWEVMFNYLSVLHNAIINEKWKTVAASVCF